LLDKQRTPFFFTICGLSIGSMLAVFLGNECVDIYAGWKGSGMVVDIVVGIVAFVAGFAITFMLYLYDKKKEQAKKSEEKN